jgi:hypothetical protein
MNPLDLTIWNCHALRRIEAIDFKAMVDFGKLSVRSRNAILFGLKNGWTRSGCSSGAGLLAHKLLLQSGVFFIVAKLRPGQSSWSRYQHIDWRWRAVGTPSWFINGITPLVEADRTAATIKKRPHVEKEFRPEIGWCPFYVLKLQDHLPGVFADYVATPEYKAATAPFIALVEGGGQIEVNVAPTTGRYWRR